MKEICPLYKVPTRNTIKNQIDKEYETTALKFSQFLSGIHYVTLTTDIWTQDMQNKSFIGVTIHYRQGIEMKSVCLDVVELTKSHTAEHISTTLQDILNKWSISKNKVVAILTDNGANMVKAVCDSFGKNRHVPCFAHTLNLVCENGINRTPNLSTLLEKVRNIVIWFKRSVSAADQLRKVQRDAGIKEGDIKKMILDIKTRWNSTFYMTERFLELAPLISTIIFDNINAPSMLSAIELDHLREVKKFLSPIETLTREISGDKYITLSKIIPMIACLTSIYQNSMYNDQLHSDVAKALKEQLLKEFDKRFGNAEKSFLLAVSTMLDPRFKNIHFRDILASANIITFLKTEVAKVEVEEVGDSSDGSSSPDVGKEKELDLWSHHKKLAHTQGSKKDGIGLKDEVSQYLSMPVRMLKDDPLVMWEEMRVTFPQLYKLACKYLPVVGTSVPCERLFSKAGLTASKSRNRLTGKRMSKLLFLQSINI